MRQVKSISILLVLLFTITSCNDIIHKDSIVIKNSDSNELTFILEMNIKNNLKVEVEDFTQYLSDFIVEREPSIIYGYYVSNDGNKVTLIERYNNSLDGIKHGEDFINGPNFEKFFMFFEIESFIVLGKASDEFKKFCSENGFVIEYRESIGGYIRK
ncbi:MAG: hypothetical protein QNK85_09605 [Crocinitomicaceae bacterium]|jgi:hypothetical protein|tara:strand:+ start:751 stop:1221 length:471 start_codon:yes stop_codon:yes gene_type:complete